MADVRCDFNNVEKLERAILRVGDATDSRFVVVNRIDIQAVHTPEDIRQLRDYLSFESETPHNGCARFYANATLSDWASGTLRRHTNGAKTRLWSWLLDANLGQRLGVVDPFLGFEWALVLRHREVNTRFPDRYEIIYAASRRTNVKLTGMVPFQRLAAMENADAVKAPVLAKAISDLPKKDRSDMKKMLKRSDDFPAILYMGYHLCNVSRKRGTRRDAERYVDEVLRGDRQSRMTLNDVYDVFSSKEGNTTKLSDVCDHMVRHLPLLVGVAFPQLVRFYTQSTMCNLEPEDVVDLAAAVYRCKMGVVDEETAVRHASALVVPWVGPMGTHASDATSGFGGDLSSRAALYDLPMHKLYSETGTFSTTEARAALLPLVVTRDALILNHRKGNVCMTPDDLAFQYGNVATKGRKAGADDVTAPAREVDGIELTRDAGAAEHASRMASRVLQDGRLWPSVYEEAGVAKVERHKGANLVYMTPMHNMIVSITSEITKMMNERWNREIDADGCRTYGEVASRVRDARPPQKSNHPSSPKWHHDEFQKRWKRLDPYQRRAVARAVIFPLSFILGPPGAGKTHVIECIFALYGNACTALSAYGIVSKMLRGRVTSSHTCHRAEAIVKAQVTRERQSMDRRGASDDDPFARLLLACPTLIFDEFSLLNVEHLLRAFNLGVIDTKRRIVFAGDPFQLTAIGAGSICNSVIAHFGAPSLDVESTAIESYCTSTLCYPHRFIDDSLRREIIEGGEASKTHRVGLGMADAHLGNKPDPSDPMSVPFNMNQMLNVQHASIWTNKKAQDPRLVYSEIPDLCADPQTDTSGFAASPFIVGSLKSRYYRDICAPFDRLTTTADQRKSQDDPLGLYDPANVCMAITDALRLVDRRLHMNHPDVQILVHTNKLRRKINQMQRDIGNSMLESVRTGSKITFNKNKYFVHSDKEGDSKSREQSVGDVGFSGSGNVSSGSERGHDDVEACLSLQKTRTEKIQAEQARRNDKNRGVLCEDVFNGDIRIVSAVYIVNVDTGAVIKRCQTVGGAREEARRQNGSTPGNVKDSPYDVMISFEDNTQISLGAYETSNIDFATAVTGTKFPGSQKPYIVYVHMENQHVDNSYIYTLMTRAEKNFIFLHGVDVEQCKEGLYRTVRRVNAPPIEDFAGRIDMSEFTTAG